MRQFAGGKLGKITIPGNSAQSFMQLIDPFFD